MGLGPHDDVALGLGSGDDDPVQDDHDRPVSHDDGLRDLDDQAVRDHDD